MGGFRLSGVNINLVRFAPGDGLPVSRAGPYDVLCLALAARTLVTALFVTRLVRLNSGEPHRAPAIWAGRPVKGPLALVKDTERRHDAHSIGSHRIS